MASDSREARSTRICLRLTGPELPEDERAELERAAQALADLAESLGWLDPLAEEPSLIFDPRA